LICRWHTTRNNRDCKTNLHHCCCWNHSSASLLCRGW